MNQHDMAAAWATMGFEDLFKRQPTTNELLIMLGVAMLETGYGQTWKGEGIGSNNVGAIQAKLPPCDPEKHFMYTDSRPQPDGTQKRYSVCFKKYDSLADGFKDLAKQLYQMRPAVLAAAGRGDIQEVAQAMYNTTYYGGFGATEAERVDTYADVLQKSVGWAAGGAGIQNTTTRSMSASSSESLAGVGVVVALGIGVALWRWRKGKS